MISRIRANFGSEGFNNALSSGARATEREVKDACISGAQARA